MTKSKQYMEGFNAAQNTSSIYPYNPYNIDRPHAEDFVFAADWRQGWEDGRKKTTKKKAVKRITTKNNK